MDMKSKTHIVVLRMKEIIYTAIFLLFIILLVVLLIFMFGGRKKEAPSTTTSQTAETAISQTQAPISATSSDHQNTAGPSQSMGKYVPGMYTSSIVLGDSVVDVAVTVDSDHINSVSLVNLSEAIATMYPLLETCTQDISRQLQKNTAIDQISYDTSNQYTFQIIMQAVIQALEQAENPS